MRDFEIRLALKGFLRTTHKDEPDTLCLDELGVCQGDARVDLAVINGAMHGYEIKSDRDKLTRLPRQLDAYGLCFDRMTVVVGSRYIGKISCAIPDWWGILEADDTGGKIKFLTKRVGSDNPRIDPQAIVRLLWRSEAQALVLQLGIIRSVKNKSRRELWNILVQNVSLDALRTMVREAIKARGNWRSVERQKSNGGSCRPAAISLHSQHGPRHLHNLEYSDPPS